LLESVKFSSVFGPQFPLVGFAARLEDLVECGDPREEWRSQEADGPVAAEDYSIGAECIEAVVDDWGEVIGGPAFGGASDDSGDLASNVFLGCERFDIAPPLVGVMAGGSARLGRWSSECGWVGIPAMVENEMGLGDGADEAQRIGQFAGADAEVEHQSAFTEGADTTNEIGLQAIPRRGRLAVEHLPDPFDRWLRGDVVEILRELGIIGSTSNDGRASDGTGLGDQLEQMSRFGAVIGRSDIDFHIDRFDLQAGCRRAIFGDFILLAEDFGGFFDPRGSDPRAVPKVLVRIEDRMGGEG